MSLGMKSIIEGRFAGCGVVQQRGHKHNAAEQNPLDQNGGACFASNLVRRRLNEIAPPGQVAKSVHMLNLALRQLRIKVFDDTDREFKTLRIAFQFQR